jgi:phenylpropionate dioxygenase-like ring-hydroxylating dioxygenase large terminal subunit
VDTTDTIVDEWFPIASREQIQPGSAHPFELLDERYLLVCDREGSVLVTADTCPHRGAQLSLGTFDGQRLQCAYHGWEFGIDGRCVHQPAHPNDTRPTPPR